MAEYVNRFTAFSLCKDVFSNIADDLRYIVQLLSHDNRKPNKEDVFCYACSRGAIDIVRFMLVDDTLGVGGIQDAMMLAADMNQVNILKLLLASGRADPNFADSELLHSSILEPNIPTIQTLLSDERVASAVTPQDIAKVAMHGSIELVSIFFDAFQGDQVDMYAAAITSACNKDHMHVVQYVLESIKDFSEELRAQILSPALVNILSFENPIGVRKASEIALLLLRAGADPSFDHNAGIYYAATIGHDDVVEIMLRDPRTDPSDVEDRAYCSAVSQGHLNIVQMLLQDHRVDPMTEYNFALREAASRGNEQMLALLLANDRIDPTAFANVALQAFAESDDENILNVFLSNPQTTAAAVRQTLLYADQVHMVQRLLQDARIDTAAINNSSCKRFDRNSGNSIGRSTI